MKRSWILIVLLLVFVAIFSVQNADVITVRFLAWNITMSAALVIQLAALVGGLVGLAAGVRSQRPEPAPEPTPEPRPSIELLGEPPPSDPFKLRERHPGP
ncbi:MAG: hypothetical protein RIQ93_3242 [Verrucomicrobiota bacterium]|jgi:hypothetical protein